MRDKHPSECGPFDRIAQAAARLAGRPAAFLAAMLLIVAWAASGPVFHFGDTWQLVINTGTTIITFLMVFLIQNSQNRDTLAMQIKLDELLRAVRGARNRVIDIEQAAENELERLKRKYASEGDRARSDQDDTSGS
ncbi:low affinity iron permease family protein [Dyella sedimenti]|uniref:low affinity iron permease family protein n=1 Tax=Dyella sedimenti TaxID=2919947 RepID=UPI001FA9469F|nr:low affinity iron permease family protein [Dyella sedimenti]